VKCDEELNTSDVIDRNELRARIGVQPTRAAEFIFVEFSVHRTGSFTENADTF
jgi:phage tail sheath protein FI